MSWWFTTRWLQEWTEYKRKTNNNCKFNAFEELKWRHCLFKQPVERKRKTKKKNTQCRQSTIFYEMIRKISILIYYLFALQSVFPESYTFVFFMMFKTSGNFTLSYNLHYFDDSSFNFIFFFGLLCYIVYMIKIKKHDQQSGKLNCIRIVDSVSKACAEWWKCLYYQ